MAKTSLASRDLEEIASIVARRRAAPIVLQKFIDVPIRVTDEVRPVVDVRGVDGGQDAVVLAPVIAVVAPPEAEGAAVAGPPALPRAVRLLPPGDPQRIACQRVVVPGAGAVAAVAAAVWKKGETATAIVSQGVRSPFLPFPGGTMSHIIQRISAVHSRLPSQRDFFGKVVWQFKRWTLLNEAIISSDQISVIIFHCRRGSSATGCTEMPCMRAWIIVV